MHITQAIKYYKSPIKPVIKYSLPEITSYIQLLQKSINFNSTSSSDRIIHDALVDVLQDCVNFNYHHSLKIPRSVFTQLLTTYAMYQDMTTVSKIFNMLKYYYPMNNSTDAEKQQDVDLLAKIYAKQGDLSQLLSGISQHQIQNITLSSSNGSSSSINIFISLLTSYSNNGNLDQLPIIHEKMISQNLKPNISYLNALLGAYGRHGNLQGITYTLDLLDKHKVAWNRTTWNNLIHGYVQASKFDEALSTFKQMKESKEIPDESTYNILINLHSKNKTYDEAITTVKEMIDCGMIPDVYTFTSLMNTFRKADNIDACLEIFKMCKDGGFLTSPAPFSVLIAFYGKKGDLENAMKYFDQMVASGIKPDRHVFESFIKVNVLGKRMNVAQDWFDKMINAGISTSALIGKLLLNGWKNVDGGYVFMEGIYKEIKRAGLDSEEFQKIMESAKGYLLKSEN